MTPTTFRSKHPKDAERPWARPSRAPREYRKLWEATGDPKALLAWGRSLDKELDTVLPRC